MKIIDFHTHFFPNRLYDAIVNWFETYAWPIQYKQHAQELVAILKSEGLSHCVSLHYPHKQGMARALNDFARELADEQKGFVIPFGSIHPDDDDAEDILRTCFDKHHFKGIKIHCHVQKVAPADPRLDALYRVCGEHKKIILIHCGSGPHFKEKQVNGYGYDVTTVSGIKRFAGLLNAHPDVTFVVPHLGFEEIEDTIRLLDDHPNLYLDTAMALAKYFDAPVKAEWLIEHADRILFGTDFPIIPYPWSRERENLLGMGLGAEVEEKILYGNAAKLLGISGNSS